MQIASARFTRITSEWKTPGRVVRIEVFHTLSHQWNVSRIIAAAHAALDRLSRQYAPYPYSTLRIVEVPRDFGSIETTGNVIFIPEDQVWLHDYRHEPAFDWIQFVIARALARTWWGDLVSAANVRGARLLTDAMPTYEALSLIQERNGVGQVETYLRTAVDEYRQKRALDDSGEPALLDVDDQEYLTVRGVLALREVAAVQGGSAMADLLARFWSAHVVRSPPFAGGRGLVDALTNHADKRQRLLSLFDDTGTEPDLTAALADVNGRHADER
jgi:hypothetical protein